MSFSSEERRKPALLEFAYLGDTTDFLQKLSEMAMPEKWEYSYLHNSRPFPILFNYLCHTYMRLKEQGKIAQVSNFYAFNTGLVTDHQQEIFAIFKEVEGRISFVKFCNESDNSMSHYNPLPERATYFENASDLFFNKDYELRIRVDHIVGDAINFERFPTDIKALSEHQLINTFNGAIEHAKKRINRNYKTAVPQFYRGLYVAEGQLQLLLPLCLRDAAKADLALAIYKDKGFYSGRTCLTLDMAINNARLIAKPDDEWLKP